MTLLAGVVLVAAILLTLIWFYENQRISDSRRRNRDPKTFQPPSARAPRGRTDKKE